MMRYALISDIHGNIDALNTVMEDLKGKKVDSFIFCGDYYCDFPYPNEIFKLMKEIERPCHMVKGNKEEYLFSLIEAKERHQQFNAVYWNYDALTVENKMFIKNMPKQVKLHIPESNSKLTVYHGHDLSLRRNTVLADFSSDKYEIQFKGKISHDDFLLYVKKVLDEDPVFQEALEKVEEDILIYGHTHVQWYYRSPKGKLVINPGSTGLALDGDNRGTYSILDIDKQGNATVEEHRVAYDYKKTIEEMRKTPYYEYATLWCEIMIKQLETGRDHISFFFDYIEDMAISLEDTQRPYSQTVWEKALKEILNDEVKLLK